MIMVVITDHWINHVIFNISSNKDNSTAVNKQQQQNDNISNKYGVTKTIKADNSHNFCVPYAKNVSDYNHPW